MSIRPAYVLPLIVLLLSGALVAACNDGDDDGTSGTTPQTSDETDGGTSDGDADGDAGDETDGDTGGGGAGEGSATLTIGDQTYTFDDYYCAFGPEETRNDRVSFSSGAFGESETGARTQLDASIQDTEEQGRYEGDGTIHSITLDDIDDFENPSVGWSDISGLLGESDAFISVDGKNVTAETTFDNTLTDEIEEVPGTLEATCP